MVGLFAFVFFAIITFVSLLLAVGIYNGLVALRKQIDRAWANIDVLLKQRHDEIPQLVHVVEQFTQHERAILQHISQARERYAQAEHLDEKLRASNEVSHALHNVLAVGEAYPQLRSSEQFLHLQQRLTSLEEQLADRREYFNDCITVYNTRTEQFPDLLFAQALGYSQLDLFKIQEEEKTKPSLHIKIAA